MRNAEDRPAQPQAAQQLVQNPSKNGFWTVRTISHFQLQYLTEWKVTRTAEDHLTQLQVAQLQNPSEPVLPHPSMNAQSRAVLKHSSELVHPHSSMNAQSRAVLPPSEPVHPHPSMTVQSRAVQFQTPVNR
jgi:hypothetical protein